MAINDRRRRVHARRRQIEAEAPGTVAAAQAEIREERLDRNAITLARQLAEENARLAAWSKIFVMWSG